MFETHDIDDYDCVDDDDGEVTCEQADTLIPAVAQVASRSDDYG